MTAAARRAHEGRSREPVSDARQLRQPQQSAAWAQMAPTPLSVALRQVPVTAPVQLLALRSVRVVAPRPLGLVDSLTRAASPSLGGGRGARAVARTAGLWTRQRITQAVQVFPLDQVFPPRTDRVQVPIANPPSDRHVADLQLASSGWNCQQVVLFHRADGSALQLQNNTLRGCTG